LGKEEDSMSSMFEAEGEGCGVDFVFSLEVSSVYKRETQTQRSKLTILEHLSNSTAGGVRFREICSRYEVDIRLLLG